LEMALKIVETERSFGPRHNCLSIVGRFAPQTKYEVRALNALLKLAVASRPEELYERNIALSWLGSFTNHPTIVLPVLVKGLSQRGQFDSCSTALVKFGPAAVPLLKEAHAREGPHVRPALSVLQAIEAKAGGESSLPTPKKSL